MGIRVCIVFLLLSFKTWGYEFIKDSHSKKIDAITLKGKSKSFLRYARNEIFARHGYPFSDLDLQTYFLNQSWYTPKSRKVDLNGIERYNINLLLDLEQNLTYDDLEVVFQSNLNGQMVYYIAKDPSLSSEQKNMVEYYDTGFFYTLNSNLLWVGSCTSIPSEFIIDHAKSTLELFDVRALWIDQIEQVELSCFPANNHVLLVRLYGPSDDPEIYILGHKNGEIQELIHLYGSLNALDCISANQLRLDMTIRHDILGTMFRSQSYTYHSNMGEVKEDYQPILNFNIPIQVLADLPYYKTKEEAYNNDQSMEMGVLSSKQIITFKSYDQDLENGPVYFEMGNKKGWISRLHISTDFLEIPIYD